MFLLKINKIALSSNDDKRIQSIDSVETYAYGTSKYLVCKKQEIKRNNSTKMILIAFHDMIANMLGNIKRHPIVTELFIRVRKLNIFLFLFAQLNLLHQTLLGSNLPTIFL